MIQIKQKGISLSDKGKIESLRQEYAETSSIILREFIEPSIVKHLLKRFETTNFVPKSEISGGYEFGKTLFVPQDEPIIFTFHLLLNNPKLFKLIEHLTDCEEIGNFTGRMHRSMPDENHLIEWHDDNSNHRLVGITLELSDEKYRGGKFQLRETKSTKIIREISDTNPGDAFIFRISPDLQHRLTVLEEGGKRTVGVGWFCSEPEWKTFSANYFLSIKN